MHPQGERHGHWLLECSLHCSQKAPFQAEHGLRAPSTAAQKASRAHPAWPPRRPGAAARGCSHHGVNFVPFIQEGSLLKGMSLLSLGSHSPLRRQSVFFWFSPGKKHVLGPLGDSQPPTPATPGAHQPHRESTAKERTAVGTLPAPPRATHTSLVLTLCSVRSARREELKGAATHTSGWPGENKGSPVLSSPRPAAGHRACPT